MHLRDVLIEVSGRGEEIPIFLGGDADSSDVCFDEKRLNEDVKWIRDTGAKWFDLGDKYNATTFDDKRYEHRNLKAEYQVLDTSKALYAMIEDHAARYKPIADQCEGLVLGNHCKTLHDRHHIDMHFEFAQMLRPDKFWRNTSRHFLDLGYRGIVRLRFKRSTVTTQFFIWLWHGNGFPSLRQTRMHSLIRRANDYVGIDLYAVGHWHDRLFWKDSSRIMPSRMGHLKLKTNTRYFAMTGTYLKGMMENHDGYQDKQAYPACELGGLRLWINPETLTVREDNS